MKAKAGALAAPIDVQLKQKEILVVDHEATGKHEEKDAEQVGPGLSPGPQVLIDDVHANKAVMEQGVSGAHEKNKSKEPPFQFLGKYITGVEQISHDHVHEDHCHEECGHPGNTAAHPLIDPVDSMAKLLDHIHESMLRQKNFSHG